MTLADLNAAWQSLRTAALGRSGFEQNVSPALASRFTQAYAGWLQWYAQAGATPEAFGSAHPEVAAWLKRYRDLAFDMRREGALVPELVTTAGEQAGEIVDSAAGYTKIVIGLAAVGLGAAWFLSRRSK